VLAARGKLFDRENRLVVDNYPSVSCFLVREQNQNVDADLPLIAKGLDLDLDQLRATLRHYRAAPGYQPIPIKQDITPTSSAFIEAHRNELPELETIDEERRLYPRDGFASHLIGYVGEVSEDDLNNPRYAYYEPGDVVGKAGVEETYDELLRGQDGSRDVIVDSHGREVGYLGIQHAKPGQDLRSPSTTTCSAPPSWPSAAATAPLWPWTRATARFWPWSRGPASIPTNLPSASTAPTGTSSSPTPTIR
jgi:penicillin-binding protein 2